MQSENKRILQISKINTDYYYCSDCETTYKTEKKLDDHKVDRDNGNERTCPWD